MQQKFDGMETSLKNQGNALYGGLTTHQGEKPITKTFLTTHSDIKP